VRTLEVLQLYSAGAMSRRQALHALRMSSFDYTHLLRLLGEAGLPIPTIPADELERQANLVASLLQLHLKDGMRNDDDSDGAGTQKRS
jgi:hypothetical protein